jgi:hypothetical protein
VGEGERFRLADDELVAAGGQLGRQRGVSEQEPIDPDPGSGWRGLDGESDLARPGELLAELLEALAKERAEPVGAHHVSRVDAQHGAKGVVGCLAAAAGVEGHAPDELGVAECLPALGAGWDALQLPQRLV